MSFMWRVGAVLPRVLTQPAVGSKLVSFQKTIVPAIEAINSSGRQYCKNPVRAYCRRGDLDDFPLQPTIRCPQGNAKNGSFVLPYAASTDAGKAPVKESLRTKIQNVMDQFSSDTKAAVSALLADYTSETMPHIVDTGLPQILWLEIYWAKLAEEQGSPLTAQQKARHIPPKSFYFG